MSHTVHPETQCSYCGEFFATKSKYTHHYRRVHRNNIKRDHEKDINSIVLRSENQKFKCCCTKEYITYESLCRHQKNCQQWKDYQTTQESSNSEGDFNNI
jgi:hypothetical protein